MSAVSAEALARSSASWTWEVRGGQPCRRRCLDWQWRRAVGIARLLEPAATGVGAWVSTEALVRIRRRPETALRPAVAVVAGGLPYDGVVDEPPLLVVELDPRRAALWAGAPVGCLWVVDGAEVVVSVGSKPAVRRRETDTVQAPGLPGLALGVSALVGGRWADSR